jgi:L-threonylcarbamoyladenylate synthase
MDFLESSKNALNKAVEMIDNGGVVIFPTDTVYGFLADAESKKAIERIYKIKKRPRSKPLPVFIKDIKMAKDLAEISEAHEKILKKYWPGKYTFILNRNDGKGTIALRVPKYKALNDLLKKVNKPLVQTSVNISGNPPLNVLVDIINNFDKQKNKPDLIVGVGNLPKRKPSAIIDLTNDKIKVLRK